MKHVTAIRRSLAAWYEAGKRDLPWRQTRDPYSIWISEIMLQQTRVAAVIPYYNKFLLLFATPAQLAEASDDALLSAWAGLGYYSRARNLREAARRITASGAFPSSYESILALPGIGPYTAAAIASISFGLPFAVLDGNVMRVLARLTCDSSDIQSAKTRQRLQTVAQALLDPEDPARHNQAIMELGATVCIPKSPHCIECPLSPYCEGRKSGAAAQFPIKLRKAEVHRVSRTLLLAIRNRQVLMWQRPPDSSQLKGFWELPEPPHWPDAKVVKPLHSFTHAITNHIYNFEVVHARVSRVPASLSWIDFDRIKLLPVSTVARKALTPLLAEME